jgi:hypothetical protein
LYGEDRGADNPYTYLEGYRLLDAAGQEIGEVEGTVYDAPSDVLKYVVVGRHAVPADRLEVLAEDRAVLAPYDRETIESAPRMERPSGEFDEALREHYAEGV